MKKIGFQRRICAAFTAVFLLFSIAACDSLSNRRGGNDIQEVRHEFPNTNWAFEEEVLDFNFTIEDTAKYYDVSVALVYDTTVAALPDIPLSLTLSTPDGMKSFSTSHFLLNRKENPGIKPTGDGNNAEIDVVVYPRRKFKVPGTYTLTVYRRADKADNFGFVSLSAKVRAVK